jgi:hypothetical protein
MLKLLHVGRCGPIRMFEQVNAAKIGRVSAAAARARSSAAVVAAYTHRYRVGSGFDNPSFYCADLNKLITHIGGYA